uniref:Uncharacterized protein n=1 Tax=Knipowitschia caucasica TaxID=637954 RepID=A0AAV2KTW3_KNICA
MNEEGHSHFRLDPSDRLNGLGQRRKRPKKVLGFHLLRQTMTCDIWDLTREDQPRPGPQTLGLELSAGRTHPEMVIECPNLISDRPQLRNKELIDCHFHAGDWI